MRQIMAERLDMLPTNKQIGLLLRRVLRRVDLRQGAAGARQLAQVLAERIDQGQYSLAEALKIAEAILYESPQQLLGMGPRVGAKPGGAQNKP